MARAGIRTRDLPLQSERALTTPGRCEEGVMCPRLLDIFRMLLEESSHQHRSSLVSEGLLEVWWKLLIHVWYANKSVNFVKNLSIRYKYYFDYKTSTLKLSVEIDKFKNECPSTCYALSLNEKGSGGVFIFN